LTPPTGGIPVAKDDVDDRGTSQSGDLPLLAFFFSERSGPARRMESLIAHLARKERSRMRVTRIDIDEHAEVASRLKVQVVPSLVLVKGKRVAARLEGKVSAPKIEAMLNEHLPPAPAFG
jgi:thioredoxin 1